MYRFRSLYLDDPPQAGRALDLFPADSGTTENAALFFVHGGGWRRGARSCFHPLMREYARRGLPCGSADYRLTGVDAFAQVRDLREGYLAFLRELGTEGRNRKVLVYGSSAGAHLAGLLSLARPGDCGEYADEPMPFDPAEWRVPDGLAVQAFTPTFHPWEDIFPGSLACLLEITGIPYEENPDAYDRLSPVRHVERERFPVFVLHAANEHMFPLRNIEIFAKRMEEAGRNCRIKTYPRVEHGFFYSLERWQQREAFDDILAFARGLSRTD